MQLGGPTVHRERARELIPRFGEAAGQLEREAVPPSAPCIVRIAFRHLILQTEGTRDLAPLRLHIRQAESGKDQSGASRAACAK